MSTIYVARRFGRLANRLVLSAHLAAYAREHGHRLVNFTLHTYAHEFANLRRELTCSFPFSFRRGLVDVIPGVAPLIRRTRICYHATRYAARVVPWLPVIGAGTTTIGDELVCLAQPSGAISLSHPEITRRIAGRHSVFVDGWQFRDPELLRQHADEVREYLRPAYKHIAAARSILKPLRDVADIVVGVHIRRGDYRSWLDGRYCFEDAAYSKWMSQISQQYNGRRVAFMICSNEPINRAAFAVHRPWAGPNCSLGDMIALSMCDLVIGPVSTYSQWASFAGSTPLLMMSHHRQNAILQSAHVSSLDVLPGITPDELIPRPTSIAA